MAENSNHYIDNQKFLEYLVKYKEKVADAKEQNLEQPKMPEFLGKCFFDLTEHMARRSEFINYSFNDEMRSDARENCIQYWYTFDATKSNNPFGYFSILVWRAFVRRILKEKKQQYVKYKLTFNSGVLDSRESLTDSDGNAIVEANLADNMHDFIQNYEQKMQEKKNLKKIKAAKKNSKPRKVKK